MNRPLLALLAVAGGGTALWFAAPHLPAVLDTLTPSETSSPLTGDRAPLADAGPTEAAPDPKGLPPADPPAAEAETPKVVAPITLGAADQGEGAGEVSESSTGTATGDADEAPTAAKPFAAGIASVQKKLSELVTGDPAPEEPAPEPEATTSEPASGQGKPPATPEAGSETPEKPAFDVVRIARDGQGVIAGRAEPGAEVEIRAGDRVIDRVVAGRRGHWVATPAERLHPEDRELSLMAYKDGIATPSGGAVLVAFAEPPPPQPPPSARREAPNPAAPQAQALARTPDEAAPGAGEEAIAVLMRADGGVGRILQAPGKISTDGGLALMVVDYDARGKVQLSGEAPPGAPVRVYVDNQPAAEVVASSAGKWQTVLEAPLAPGDYTLRLDQLGPSGEPVARLETPFTRAGQPAAPEGGDRVDYVIVQPGNSLWRISRRLFGSGIRHVEIYETNRGQIRDPDLIYPGQVFAVPESLRGAS